MTMLRLIKSLDFFSQIPEAQLEPLVGCARIKTYATAEIMQYEEDDVGRVYFLIDGEAKFYKVDRYDNEIFLYTLQSNALLTNIGSLDDLF